MAIFRYFFNFACFSVAFGMTLMWLYRFSLDEDSVQIDFKQLDFQAGYYPMLSFCLIDPFIESRLKEYNATLTVETYIEFLEGLISFNEMTKIDFDDITLDLKDFYLDADLLLKDGSYIELANEDVLQGLLELTYSGFHNGIFMKCFGLKSKLKHIDELYFRFNTSIYPNGIRPSSKLSTVIGVHLPNQFSLVGNSLKYTWPNWDEIGTYTMIFSLQQIDIIKRRNKRNDPCISDDFNFDQMIWDSHLDIVGCKPPYHSTNKKLEVCNSAEKINGAYIDLIKREKPMKACTSASTLAFSYNEQIHNSMKSDWFGVGLEYPNQYKEIKMVQAIDIQTVIGNAGGYIGLFLGKIS